MTFAEGPSMSEPEANIYKRSSETPGLSYCSSSVEKSVRCPVISLIIVQCVNTRDTTDNTWPLAQKTLDLGRSTIYISEWSLRCENLNHFKVRRHVVNVSHIIPIKTQLKPKVRPEAKKGKDRQCNGQQIDYKVNNEGINNNKR